MATFTKTDVETFYAQRHRKENISWVLDALEDRIIEGRDDERAIPIYLTKQRVKSVDSLYLKTKRRTYEFLDDVTDVAGLRVLCLFGQDILKVHKYLVGLLREGGYNLTEFEIYNWLDDSYIKELVKVVEDTFTAHKFKAAKKGSGYKSLHYVVTQTYGGGTYPIEIQLRTLLQDVWGELEHSLVYKQGNIHHHIKESFQLLSKDLENMDSLMANLRDTRNKESRIGLFALKEGGPSPPFGYDTGWLPQILTQATTPIGTAYQEYKAYMEDVERDYLNLRGWAEEALRLYRAVAELLVYKDSSEPHVQYWLLMERAYVVFVLSKYDDEELYTEATRKWKEWCIPSFRLGELYLIKGETVKALELFDKCGELLLKQEVAAAQVAPGSTREHRVTTKRL